MVSGTQPDSPRPAIERDGIETGAGSSVSGQTGPLPGASGSESGNDDSGELGGPLVVRAVAEALAGVDGWEIRWPREGEEPEEPLVRYLALARAAVQALRDGSDQ